MNKIKSYAWVFDKFSRISFLSPIKAVVLIGAIISTIAIIFVPKRQIANAKLTDEKRIELENTNRVTVVQVLGGLFFFSTAYLTWRSLQVSENNLKLTEKNLLQSIESAREKQITESFTGAIVLLGNESIHVRIGAIYVLERIGKDSHKDLCQILDILMTYVREVSPYNAYQDKTYPIPTDVKTAVIVIIRLTKDIKFNKEYFLDFSETNLYALNFEDANLEYANFQEANLRNIKFQNAKLNNAKFQKANLESANLKYAVLIESNFDSELHDEENKDYQLRTNLCESNLEGAKLERANMKDIDLSGAYLKNATLKNANLEGAYLLGKYDEDDEYYPIYWRTYLCGANLDGANLKSASLDPEEVKSAINWDKAIYDPEFYKELDLPYMKNN